MLLQLTSNLMLKRLLLDILLPKKCVNCRKEGQYICEKCEIFLSEVPDIIEADSNAKDVMSVWQYEGILEKAISKIKKQGQYDIINELVDKAFEKMSLVLPDNTYITYVPLWKKRERELGFNQARLIAQRIGEITNKEVLPLLVRVKDTLPQKGLTLRERQENVKGVFAVSFEKVITMPKTVLLVDDIYVSGATAKECVKTLKEAGVKNVQSFALCRQLTL